VELSPAQAVEAGSPAADVFEQAQQAFDNTKADYESAVALRKTQEEQLAYYSIRAPFTVSWATFRWHGANYVSSTTMLTTVDEGKDLEAYIYIPTERSSQVRLGLDVDLLDTSGKLLGEVEDRFLSPQVEQHAAGHPA